MFDSGKEEGVRVERWICDELIERGLHSGGGRDAALSERVQDTHERFARAGSGGGLGAEGNLSRDDEGPQVAFGEVVFGRDGGIARPVVKPVLVLAEEVLDFLDVRVKRLAAGDGDDPALGPGRAAEEFLAGKPKGAKGHRLGEGRDERLDEGGHLRLIGRFLLNRFDIALQVGVAVFQRDGSVVVGVITIDNQHARQRLFPQDLRRHDGRAGGAEAKQAQFGSGKEPDVSILAVGAPTGLIGVFDRSMTPSGMPCT